MTVNFTIRNSQLVPNQALEKAFELPDGNYEMTIKRRGRRSVPLNNYYWGCVIEIEQEGLRNIGYDWSKEQVHEFNKSEFNYTEVVNPVSGEVKRAPVTTTDLTNTQFLEFLERIKIFCAEWLNTYVPDPNEQTKLSY